MIFSPTMIIYEGYSRIVILGVVLSPVLRGMLVRPQFIYPAIPWIRLVLEAVVLRLIFMNALRLPELFVVIHRLEVLNMWRMRNFVCIHRA